MLDVSTTRKATPLKIDYETRARSLALSYKINLTLTEEPNGNYCLEIDTMRSFYNLLDDHFLCLDQDNVELLEDGETKVPLASTWEYAFDLLMSGVWECPADCFDCN